jgi:hypothetical protein
VRAQKPLDKKLDPAAALLAADEPRLDDPGVVKDQAVPTIDQRRKAGEGQIFERAVGQKAQQAARAALRRGVLGDERGRQRIVELGNKHLPQL